MSKMQLRPAGKVFPNLNSTLGAYDPTIQCIFLHCMDKQDYTAIKKNPAAIESAEKMGVLIHEMRHYVDHISTLWGHENILAFQEAAASIINYDEYKFQPVISYMREENRVFQEKYYQEHYNQVKFNGKPWSMSHSTGLKFDFNGSIEPASPIVFAKFKTGDGIDICRVPITIAALLEVSAMSAEIDFRMSCIVHSTGSDAPIYGKMYTNELLEGMVYNQALAVYNVAAHIIANNFDIKLIEVAYKIASKIAVLTLNMPDEYLANIPVSERFKDGKGSETRIKQAIENKDAGAIFLALTTNYAARFNEDKEYELSALLEVNNLPNATDFTELVNSKMLRTTAAPSERHRLSFIPQYYTNLLISGAGVFRDRGLDGSDMEDGESLTKYRCFPATFLGDATIPEPPDGLHAAMANIDESPAFRYHFVWEARKKMNTFFEIRGL